MHWFVKIPYRTNWNILLQALIGALWFLLVLYPLGHAEIITGFSNFVYILFAFFIVDVLRFRWYLSGLLKCLIILVFMHTFFFSSDSFLEPSWVGQFFGESLAEVNTAFNGDWELISNSTQSLALLLGLWVGVRMYTYGVRNVFWIGVLLVAGEAAFGLYASFLTIDTNESMLLYTIVGFFLLMYRNYSRVRKWIRIENNEEDELSTATIPNSWFAWLGLVAAIVIGFVFIAPKPEGVWANPYSGQAGTSDIPGQGGQGNGRVLMKSGFTEDTASLGGSFVQDETIAFNVITPDETYYRADSKSYYTGHGWQYDDKNKQLGTIVNTPFTFASEGTWDGFQNLKTRKIKQTYQIKSGTYNRFFTAYQVEQAIDVTERSLWVGSTIDFEHESISAYLVPGDQYQAVSEEAYQSNDKLMQVQSDLPYPETVAQEYLQLPPELPKRVKQLAQDITSKGKGPYEKAQAISDYLQSNYTYETKGIPVPGHNQDFVDQFLFDTKKGYCDHFSSAMVVLSRSVGIPARWVTGFAPGTKDDTYQGPDSRYIVRQKDAHAWAEVYIQGYGWIPSEPTPGFSIPQPVEEQQATTVPAGDTSTTTKVNKNNKIEKSDSQQTTSPASVQSTQNVVINSWWLYSFLFVCASLGWIFRRKLRYQWLVFRYQKFGRNKDNLSQLVRSSEYLIHVARKRGYIGVEQITFREFVGKLHALDSSEFDGFQPLITAVEQSSYSEQQVDPNALQKAWDLWNKIARWLYK